MPAFKFKLAERVALPGDPATQVRVAGRSESIGGPNVYQIAWLDDAMQLQSKLVPEAELADAQPKPVDPVDQVVVTAKTAAKLPANEFKPPRRPASKRKSRR
jgi:hypothetical protein